MLEGSRGMLCTHCVFIDSFIEGGGGGGGGEELGVGNTGNSPLLPYRRSYICKRLRIKRV